jgi:hypothetical protein
MAGNGQPKVDAGGRTVTTVIVVPVVAAVLGAVAGAWAGKSYDSAITYLSPDKISGNYVVLESNNEPNEPNKSPVQYVLNLQSHDGVVSGTGERANKRWIYSGYLKDRYVVLSYRSADPMGTGFGTYFFLADQSGEGREYKGYFEGALSPEGRIFRCNSVLLKSEDASTAKLHSHDDYMNAQCVLIPEFTKTL